MRRIVLVLVFGLVCGSAWSAGGDMGGADPNGSEGNPWLIEDFTDFQKFSSDPNYWAIGVHTKLMTDIDLDPNLPGRQTYTTTVIAPEMGPSFAGVFDGNDFSIRNLTIDTAGANDRFIGLFGIVTTSVKNLGIDNVTIRSDSTLISGLTGVNAGTITNCYVTGSIEGWGIVGGICGNNDGSITDSYVIGTISGDNIVGGICGKNYEFGGGLTNCYTACTVNGNGTVGGLCGTNSGNMTNCYSTGDVSGNFVVGGLAGSSGGGSLTNCYSTGDVSGIEVVGGLVGENGSNNTNCYSACSISGDNLVGALMGNNYGLNTSCFWDVETSGIADLEEGIPDTDGMIGLSTSLMMTQSTFSGWDFSDGDGDPADWMMLRELEDYPRLAWQEVFVGDIAGLYGADMVDFAYLGNYWGLDDCDGADDCGRADIDGGGDVGIGDLAAVADDWLKGIGSW